MRTSCSQRLSTRNRRTGQPICSELMLGEIFPSTVHRAIVSSISRTAPLRPCRQRARAPNQRPPSLQCRAQDDGHRPRVNHLPPRAQTWAAEDRRRLPRSLTLMTRGQVLADKPTGRSGDSQCYPAGLNICSEVLARCRLFGAIQLKYRLSFLTTPPPVHTVGMSPI